MRSRARLSGPPHGLWLQERRARRTCRTDAWRCRPRSEDRVDPVDAVDGGAAAAGFALVAGRRAVIKIEAARPLQQVAAGRGHIAQLLRGAGQDRTRQYWIAPFDQRVI